MAKVQHDQVSDRKPPFEVTDSLYTVSKVSTTQGTGTPGTLSTPVPRQQRELVLPAVFIDQEKNIIETGDLSSDPCRDFMYQDLDVSRLNKVHRSLWFAGLPNCARSLHQQVLLGRSILVAERADLHLLWRDGRIYIKPLPEYLLFYDTWTAILCKDQRLFEEASGMLLSYMWLICSKSDLDIAHENKLISTEINWSEWTFFIRSVFKHTNFSTLHDINPRYLYGELRIARLNLIYRFSSATRSNFTLIRGYQYGYSQYSTFIERNFAWLLTAIIYITVVLTALQVGLGTHELRDNPAFNRVSYGFTIFAIIAPLAVLLAIAVILSTLVVSNFRYALAQTKIKKAQFSHLFDNPVVRQEDQKILQTGEQYTAA